VFVVMMKSRKGGKFAQIVKGSLEWLLKTAEKEQSLQAALYGICTREKEIWYLCQMLQF
jgi:hypothetical protein